MPQTPTDPTKAQVWVTGTAPNQQLEFYIPRGAKGEPGGITLGTVLGTANLDDIKTSGVYRQTSAANATPLNNYPEASLGIVVVHEVTATTHLEQEFRPFWFSPTTRHASVFYRRQLVLGVWSSWKVYPSNRVDQTAGRAIYQWDNVNHREQLIYGDTGWRSIIGQSVSGVGALHIRRNGHMVTINAVGLNSTAGASYVTVFASGQLPGFQPSITMRSVATTAAGAARILDLTGGLEMRLFAPEAAPYSFSIAYPTSDNWPTTLPGTAVGSIPNL